MSAFRLLPLGVGNAFSARYYSSSFALQAEGQWLLVDCPHPIRKLLREASATAGFALDVAQLGAIVLTHLHADHASGLEGIAFYCRYVLGRTMPLYTLPAIATDLWPHHLAAGMEWSQQAGGAPPMHRNVEEFFALHELSPAGPCACGPFTVACRPTIHNIPTIALRITAGGRTLGYSADTAFDPGLIDW